MRGDRPLAEPRPLALLLTPVLPLPGGCGRALRAWDWLLTLAREHRVGVLVAAQARAALPPEYPAQAVTWLAEAAAPARRWRRRAGLLCPPLALRSARFALDWLHPVLSFEAAAARLGEPPAGATVRRIVVFRLYLHELGLALARRHPGAVLELDLDDLESRTRSSVAAALLRLGRRREAARELAGAFQYRLLERRIAPGYRTLHLAAERDCRRLRERLPARRIAARPNRLRAPDLCPAAPPAAELRLLFVGTLDYPPNEEAARLLVERLVPALAGLGRAWRLCIAGRRAPPALLRRLRGDPRVELYADVDELGPLYAAAHVVLVPLRAGGGTKLKALEAFAHRRPLVSTRHGVRGLGAAAEVDYLRAESAAEFAGAIARLGRDEALAERLAGAGRALFEKALRIPDPG